MLMLTAIHAQLNQQSNEPGIKLKSDVMVWKDVTHDENTNELTRAILATVIFVAENYYRMEHYTSSSCRVSFSCELPSYKSRLP